MNISFTSLSTSHFLLLLKWLETPHVKLWWDQDVKWSLELIEKKYLSYVKGYKLENNDLKHIQAYIIEADRTPIGYIQIYNAYDFEHSSPLINLPSKLAAIDYFLGEPEYLNKGVGLLTLRTFSKKVLKPFPVRHQNHYIYRFGNVQAFQKIDYFHQPTKQTVNS